MRPVALVAGLTLCVGLAGCTGTKADAGGRPRRRRGTGQRAQRVGDPGTGGRDHQQPAGRRHGVAGPSRAAHRRGRHVRLGRGHLRQAGPRAARRPVGGPDHLDLAAAARAGAALPRAQRRRRRPGPRDQGRPRVPHRPADAGPADLPEHRAARRRDRRRRHAGDRPVRRRGHRQGLDREAPVGAVQPPSGRRLALDQRPRGALAAAAVLAARHPGHRATPTSTASRPATASSASSAAPPASRSATRSSAGSTCRRTP